MQWAKNTGWLVVVGVGKEIVCKDGCREGGCLCGDVCRHGGCL